MVGSINSTPDQTYPIPYPTTAVVTKIDREKDEVTFTVPTSYTKYVRSGVEDWNEGDVASMMMNNMGTPEIKDDKILKAYYSGLTIYDVKGFLNEDKKGDI